MNASLKSSGSNQAEKHLEWIKGSQHVVRRESGLWQRERWVRNRSTLEGISMLQGQVGERAKDDKGSRREQSSCPYCFGILALFYLGYHLCNMPIRLHDRINDLSVAPSHLLQGAQQPLRDAQEAAVAGLDGGSARVGAELQLLSHALLEVIRQGVVQSLEDVGAGDAVGPGRKLRGSSEQGGRSPGHLLGPVRLLIGGQVVEADLGHHAGVASDTVTLGSVSMEKKDQGGAVWGVWGFM